MLMFKTEAEVLVPRGTPSEAVLEEYRKHHYDPENAAHWAQVTAFHEACHVVANVMFGVEITSVSIVPTGSAAGGVMREGDVADAETDAVTTLAGVIGAFLAEGSETVQTTIANDIGQVMALVVRIAGKVQDPLKGSANPDEIQRVLEELWQKTCALMIKPNALVAVRRVAEALLAAGELQGDEVAVVANAGLKEEPSAEITRAADALLGSMGLHGRYTLRERSTRFLNDEGTGLDPAYYRSWMESGEGDGQG